jgi:putative rhs family protein
LESLTNARGETWYYKYDALGRRTEKACPQQNITTRYLWDGDQVAYQETERYGKTESKRHSIFNGWELIAQQDGYQKQDLRSNHKQWTQTTGYAVCQPNGQPLALFNPQGKRTWRKAPNSLWGLPLLSSWERKQAEPLNPNLLFAGQYTDDESGLACNRFRYYDLQSGCYLKSDPIGLLGGETPYAYVHNPMGWVDPFGLAVCSVRYGRYKDLRKIRYSAKDATRLSRSTPDQLLKNGKIDYTELQERAGVNGLQNSWHPNPQKFPTGGFKYQTGQYSAHGHGANPAAQTQYPGSNAAMGPTVSIKGPQGNLRTDGTWGTFGSAPNSAHIPLINSPF